MSTLRVLSLGAGVQSTTMLLMGLRGEFGDLPDAAVFADTQAEPAGVYEHLAWLEREVAPFPIHRVTAGNLFTQIGRKRPTGEWRHMPIPAFIAGADGRPALANRSCTRDFKIDPIVKKVRELAGLTKKRAPKVPVVEQWIGISLDEASRMKPSRESWVMNRWPLIDLRMTRHDCLRWLADHGYPEPAKSACTFCPYHDDRTWRRIRDTDPDAWGQALEIDARIRDMWKGRVPSGIYLHRSLRPLDEVDLSTPEDHGQGVLDGFGAECEGMCGV